MQLSLTTTVTPSCTREGEAYRLVEYLPTYKVALKKDKKQSNNCLLTFENTVHRLHFILNIFVTEYNPENTSGVYVPLQIQNQEEL